MDQRELSPSQAIVSGACLVEMRTGKGSTMDQGGHWAAHGRFTALRRLCALALAWACYLATPYLATPHLAAAQQLPAPAQQPKAAAAEAAKPAPDKAAAIEAARNAAKKATEASEARKAAAQAVPLPGQIQMRGRLQIAPNAAALRAAMVRRSPDGGGETEAVFFPADRATMQRLSKAKELLDEKRFGEGVRLLGEILEGPEDFFFQPKKDEPIHRSLKAEAQRLIGQMPSEGRASYELQSGAEAQKMLDEAVEAADATRLAEVSRRFFHTKAGSAATHLLGMYQLDHSQPLAAALCLSRLQASPAAAQFEPMLAVQIATCWARAGMSDKAAQTLAALRERSPEARVVVAGQEKELFRDSKDALAWLTRTVGPQQQLHALGAEQWPLFRGSPNRNSVSSGSSPLLNRRWGVPVSDDNGSIAALLKQLQQTAIDQGSDLLPALHPLAVNDYVFMRSVSGLVAIDFKTGKRIWRGSIDESVDQLLEPDVQYGNAQYTRRVAGANVRFIGGRAVNTNNASMVPGRLSQRVWEDATFGTMSSDGESVFCIEDLEIGQNFVQPRSVVLANGRRVPQTVGPRTYNRLAAYDIATEGKLKWEVDGAPTDETSELAGAFFLGPPLPLVGWLYVLVEVKGEIRLICLESATGKVEWTQQLAVLESSILEDPLRRVAGVSPSYSDGVLVCPTSAGAAVAVDLTTRSLLWGYQYARTEAGTAQQRMLQLRMAGMGGGRFGFNGNISTGSNGSGNSRWADASVTIAEGYVLLTPPESNQLHCINLIEGTVLWQKPRDDGLYVACVAEGKAVVVGQSSVRAMKLADGEPAWGDGNVPLPTGSVPSGRGFFNGKRYHLPLSSAEVAVIDVASGRIVARSKSRTGTIPGNLICYKGAVISQGVDVLERFDQRDDLLQQIGETLKKNADDAPALARRGELLLDEGNFQEAIASLRRSHQLLPDKRTQELFIDSMLEGLRMDFAANRGLIDEVAKLVEQPVQRRTFLRLVATGLQTANENLAAFKTYMEFAAIDGPNDELERVDHALSVRRDRWVQARLAALRQAAKPEERAEMDKAIVARLQVARASEGPAALRSFLGYFGSHPAADEARELLVQRLTAPESSIEAEQLLLRMARSSDAPRERTATARLAALMELVGRNDEAAALYRRIAGQWNAEVCLDGKTGAQLIAALPEKSEVRKLLAPSQAWPIGQVQKSDQRGQPTSNTLCFPVNLAGDLEPFYSRASVKLEYQQQSLVGKDGFGRDLWRVPVNEPNQARSFVNPQASHGRVSGHLLLVSTGFEVLAIDTLGGGSQESARILWRQDLVDNLAAMAGVGLQQQVVQAPWAAQRFVAADSLGRPIGSIGPITAELACYQRQRNVSAVRALSGETLWTRSDIQPGSEIFGDDDMLFVVEPNATEAIVLRAMDGHDLGRRPVPPVVQRVTNFGRRLLSWVSDQGKVEMRLTDLWDQKVLWEKKFDPTAHPWLVDQRAMGVLDQQGHFQLISLPDGKSLVDAKLDPDPALSDVYVLATPTSWLLVANRPIQNVDGVHRQSLPGGYGNPLVNGVVHVFDRQTGSKIASTAIDRHGLLLSQPSDLPVLAFATTIFDATSARGRNQQTSLLFLDKRTGRVVYEGSLPNAIPTIDLVGEPERNYVQLKTPSLAVRLTFTGEPVTDTPTDKGKTGGSKTGDGKAGAAKPQVNETSAAARAVFRGLQNWAGLNATPRASDQLAPVRVELPASQAPVFLPPEVQVPVPQ